MTSRYKDWVDRYVKFVHSLRSTQFEFGKHDCCITSCHMIDAITGTNPGKQFVYDSPIKALRIVKDHGDVDGIAEKVCDQHGWPEVNPNYANRCDLVCVDLDGHRKALGWLDLDATKIYAPAMIGLQILPRSKALRAWRIG